MATSIGSTYTRDTRIGSTCAIGTWIGYSGIANTCTRVIYTRSTSDKGVELRALPGSRVTLAGPGVNDC